MIGFPFDITFKIVIVLAGWEQDFLADDRRIGQCQREVLEIAAQALVATLDGLNHGIEVVDVALDHGFRRQQLNRIPFQTVGAFARVDDLDHLDGRGTDVCAYQRRHLGLEQSFKCVEVQAEFSFSHKILGQTP